ncbi:LacI family DNA-binding transcriptional regulator [uncultured Tessaracoccus sp.]|uniref:LacI family DNA-binding transcriptional regulator n=1 Tax=uncultured Tessaracoccus sp. TaxID=905023 RepID=UPI0025EE6373|nr:LacI family DNA-binding transcriptional regulator [uncultured Tessaracoccus sp.]
MGRVTIRDIAREAGVGVTSVSRALNDQPGLSARTRARILAVAERLDFSPNPHARSLKAKQNPSAISALVKGPANPMFQVLGDHLETDIRGRGLTYEIVRVTNEEDIYDEARRVGEVERPAGMLLLGGAINPTPDQVAAIPSPFVLVTTPLLDGVDPTTYSSVRVDEEQSVALQVQSLVDRGHRRIAYLGMPADEHAVGAVRLAAFVATMTRLGLDCGPELQLHAEGWGAQYYSFDYGHRLASELLDRGTDVTAICAASDTIALGAHKAIVERGHRIPDDFAVVGFDGIEQTRWVHPSLATIRQPVEDIAGAACDLLFRRIGHGGEHQHVVFPGSLVTEASLGPHRER